MIISTGKNLADSQTNRLISFWLLVIGTFVFFGIRFYYWSLTNEAPFSDMADYAGIAAGVRHDFNFSAGPFWRSYKPPTLPLFGAATFWLFGDYNFLAWRIVLSAICFLSLIWSCVEFNLAARRNWPGLLLLWVVALSKPSIFWSYKFSTEGLAEALSYACLAAGLYSLRTNQKRAYFIWGTLAATTLLNRPQFLITIPLMLLLPMGIAFFNRGDKLTLRKYLDWVISRCLLFVLGLMLLWTPWMVRSYNLYGHIVPLSTQGPYSFLWELGNVSIVGSDGNLIVKDRNALQLEAPSQFKNDYEAQQYASLFVKSWLKDNLPEYCKMLGRRLVNTITDRDVQLTHVSREDLIISELNWLLIDKSMLLVCLGGLGLLLLAGLNTFSLASILPSCIALGPWLFGILFLGYGRILEPSLPLIIYGAIIGPFLLVTTIRAKSSGFKVNN